MSHPALLLPRLLLSVRAPAVLLLIALQQPDAKPRVGIHGLSDASLPLNLRACRTSFKTISLRHSGALDQPPPAPLLTFVFILLNLIVGVPRLRYCVSTVSAESLFRFPTEPTRDEISGGNYDENDDESDMPEDPMTRNASSAPESSSRYADHTIGAPRSGIQLGGAHTLPRVCTCVCVYVCCLSSILDATHPLLYPFRNNHEGASVSRVAAACVRPSLCVCMCMLSSHVFWTPVYSFRYEQGASARGKTEGVSAQK